MKTLFKILGFTAGTLLVLLVVGFIVLFKTLPGPKEVKSALKPANTDAGIAVNESNAVATPPEDLAPPRLPPSASTLAPIAKAQNSKDGDKVIIEKLIDDKSPVIQVCDHLEKLAESEFRGEEKTAKPLDVVLEQNLSSEDKDPYIESFAAVIKAAFRGEQIQKLVRMFSSMDEKEQDSFAKKAEFYKQVYAVYGEIKQRKTYLETVSDQSYHLFILSRAVEKKPELANDPTTLSFCRSIENTMNDRLPSDINLESSEVLRFLEYAGIDAEDVGYNPDYRTKFEVKFNKSSVGFSGGWMDEFMSEKISR